MIGLPPGAKVWLAAGATDMRRGFDGLAALAQSIIATNTLDLHRSLPAACKHSLRVGVSRAYFIRHRQAVKSIGITCTLARVLGALVVRAVR